MNTVSVEPVAEVARLQERSRDARNSCEFRYGKRPGLLVSVRNAAEAFSAVAGRADVVDVKEPERGPLGRADAATIAAVVRAVSGQAPVTAALGELLEINVADANILPPGVSLFKIGLAGCGAIPDWRARWQKMVTVLSRDDETSAARPVAVAYADWLAADAPAPDDVLNTAVELRCPVLLIDTWNKSGGSLFHHWPADHLAAFIRVARSHHLGVVLAGSLDDHDIITASQLRPDLVAVRAAACIGGRDGTVSTERVQALGRLIAAAVLSGRQRSPAAF